MLAEERHQALVVDRELADESLVVARRILGLRDRARLYCLACREKLIPPLRERCGGDLELAPQRV